MRRRGPAGARLAHGLYRALLLLYPPGFRRRFGERMLADVTDLVRVGRRNGTSRTRLVLRVALDLFRSVPREWSRALCGERAAHLGQAPGEDVGAGWRMRAAMEDLRMGARALIRRPGFSVGLVLLLGVGIGAATAVASVASAYLLRPLPYPEADRLVLVRPVAPVPSREVADLFEIPVTWDLDAFSLVGPEGTELVEGAWVSAGYFEAFGVEVALGRLFGPDETGPGGSAVAVIDWELWQRRWGGDPGVIGATVRAHTADRPDDAELFTIVGVLRPDTWHYNQYTRFLAPLRGDNPVYAARLRADLPAEQARRRLEERGRSRMTEAPPDFRVDFVPLQEGYAASLRPLIAVGAVAAAILLVVTLANGAVLLLLRAQKREKELWVRRALGAGRGRLARQLLVEAVVLAVAAGGVGLLLAGGGLAALGGALQASLGREVPGGVDALGLDATALAATALTGALAAVVFTVAPWLGAWGVNGTRRGARTGGLAAGLAEAGRGNTGGKGRARLRNVLVTAEIALSLTLVVGGALAVRSARHLSALDLGFDPDRVWVSSLLLRAGTYPEAEDRAAFFGRLAAALRDEPAFEAAALSATAPFGDFVPGRVEGEEGAGAEAVRFGVGPGWLATLDVPLLRGRDVGIEDGPGTEPVVVVGRRLAEALWPGRDPLGRRFRLREEGVGSSAPPGPWLTVVGVAGDLRGRLEGAEVPSLYLPLAQGGARSVTMTVRVRAGTAHPLADLERIVASLDPSVALFESGWVRDSVADALRPPRFLAVFLTGFASLALALAAVGLYAVLSFAAAERRRDVAIRMALGAQRGAVVRHFVREGMGLALGGVVLGTVGAALLARRLAGQLHGVDATAPATYGLAALGLVLVTLLATWIPARRASGGDPVLVLRQE